MTTSNSNKPNTDFNTNNSVLLTQKVYSNMTKQIKNSEW